MAYKSWKPKNNNYIDGAGIRVNRKTLLDYIFPVGSVFLTVNKVNPGTFLGGTWEQISGGYMYLAANSLGKTDFYGWGTQSSGQGNTGSTALTANQMPNHGHSVYMLNKSSSGSAKTDYYQSAGAIRVLSYNLANIAYDNTEKGWWNSAMSTTAGGGRGHSHTIGNHSHDIATIDVFAYKRIA